MPDNLFLKAKQALLASGLPLEMSVERRIRARGFHQVTADFTYWRRSEGGHKDFSVDVRALGSFGVPQLFVPSNAGPHGAGIIPIWDILVECKYRNPSVKWIFAPLPNRTGPISPHGWLHPNTHFFLNGMGHEALGSVEAGHLDVRPRDANGIPDNSAAPVAVTRGVEFRPGQKEDKSKEDKADEAFSAPIRRAIYQLQFAHVPRLADTLALVGSRRWSEAPVIDLHLVISTLVLVTTAELWTFRPDVDLVTIEHANALDDIAERVDAVEYVTVASRELRAHQEEWIAAIERRRTFGPPEHESQMRELWKAVTSAVVSASPSVLIVHLDDFEATLDRQAKAIEMRVRKMVEDYASARGFTVR